MTKYYSSCSNCMTYAVYNNKTIALRANRCPKCKSPIDIEDKYWVCKECGSHVDINNSECWKCSLQNQNKKRSWW